jgi:hypothetical protein
MAETINIDKKVVVLGNIYGRDKGTSFAGNVWDKNGICPTITTSGGGIENL